MIDFSEITSISTARGSVKQIADINGTILWTKPNLYHENLRCFLSAHNNTRSGYNANAAKWEDLSGYDNDFTLSNVTFDGENAVFNGSNSKGESSFILQYPYTVIVKFTKVSTWASATTVPVHNYDPTTSTKGDGIIQRATSVEVSYRTGTIASVSVNKPTADSVVIAYTRDANGNGNVYVDNVLKGTKTGLTTAIAYPYMIGGSQTLWYKGGIEYIKIYNAVLPLNTIIEETD